MSVFLDYLEEAYDNVTELTKVEFAMYVRPLVAHLIIDCDRAEEDILLHNVPTEVNDYFATEFERCPAPSCKEWNRKSEMVQSRFDYLVDICEGCRTDGY